MEAVIRQDLLVAGRRQRSYFLRWVYAFIVIVQLVPRMLFDRSFNAAGTEMVYFNFFATFVAQHFFFLFLLIPPLTAGAITDEKTGATLDDLLSAGIGSFDLVLGKLMGRVYQLCILAMVGLPIVCFFGNFSQMDAAFPLALFAVSLVVIVSVGSLGMLASVWCRRSRDSILLTYLVLLVGFIAAGMVAGTGASWLVDAISPWHAVALDAPTDRWPRLLLLALAWLLPAVLCLLLAVWRLRPAHERQRRQRGRGRWRWLQLAYPPVFGNPVTWREWFVQGIAPLAWFRLIPWWLALPAVFAFSGVTMTWLLLQRTGVDVWGLLWQGDAVGIIQGLINLRDNIGGRSSPETALGHTSLAFLVFTLIVAVRSSGTITEERESGTWDALMMTPLTTRQIVYGKFWGVLLASAPYLAAYAVGIMAPMVLAFDYAGIIAAVVMLSLTALACILAASFGTLSSAFFRSTWRSLLATVGICYAAYVVLTIMFYITSCILMCFFFIIMMAVQGGRFGGPGGDPVTGVVLAVLLVAVGMIFPTLVIMALSFAILTGTVSYVDRTDRIRARGGAGRDRMRRRILEMEEDRGYGVESE